MTSLGASDDGQDRTPVARDSGGAEHWPAGRTFHVYVCSCDRDRIAVVVGGSRFKPEFAPTCGCGQTMLPRPAVIA